MTGRPRIGYLVQQFAPEVGAGPARVVEMADRWIERGADVTVITAMPNRPQGIIVPEFRGKWFTDDREDGRRVLRSWLYATPRSGFLRTLANNATFMVTSALHGLVRARNLDVLIASSPPFFPHAAGAFLSFARRVPLVLELRDLWPDYLADMGVLSGRPLAALYAAERALLRRADYVAVVTESFRRRVIAKGVPDDRVTVLPNGVDAAFYHRADEPPPIAAMRRTGASAFTVGYLGNIGAGQGMRVLVDAAARLAVTCPDVRVVIAGDGPDRAALTAYAAALGLPNLTLHPSIPKRDTRAFYNACDVCVVPLAPIAVFQETVPSKLFEIMACERPVIASLAGEGASIVEQSGGGVHVAPGDSAALAEAIVRMRDVGAAGRRTFGSRGRAYVCAHYDRRAIADRYLDVLCRVAGHQASAGTPRRAAVDGRESSPAR